MRAFGLLDHRDEAREGPVELPPAGATFPRKRDFLIDDGYTYLNAAYTHPIPLLSLEAARQAADARARVRASPPSTGPSATARLRANFAQLINASPSEIAFVSSTSAGENLVVRALGLDHRFDGNVVTDGLHFEGALMHLAELRKKGLDVRVAAPTADARIDLRDLERLIDNRTRLVEVSAAAMYNGFQHDLKAIATIAHAHGAYVYVDMVHAAGAEPFDVRATGIDFAACSSFKWLMGDFGLGFLFARQDVLERLERPVVGYYQSADLEPHYPPFLPTGSYTPVTYTLDHTAAGMFETGALTGSAEVNVALLSASLSYVQALGVGNIQAHRVPLVRRLQAELPRLGWLSVTPADSTAGNVTFARENVGESDVARRLAAAKINVRLARHWMRLSPSVYNDMRDIDRLLDALS